MIPVRNIYYMLAYAFQVLNAQGYKEIATEQFNNVAELFAAILAKGLTTQLKRGLAREYFPYKQPLSSLRGRINISESIKDQTILKQQMICTYDDFSINSYLNQIIKSTMESLLLSDISKERKKKIRKLVIFFREVESLNIHTINWKIQYNRNNQNYKMLISICYLVVKGLLQTNSDGSMKLLDFIDEQRMSRLYEKFILEYYRKEFKDISVSSSQIPWQLDDDNDLMLPVMQTDIMLTRGNKTLIIDTKYYTQAAQTRFNVQTVHSGNLYQIFTYVKNKESELHNKHHEVSGMLLYAKTDESLLPNNTYKMKGNRIIVRTLDLDCDFEEIAKQLNEIVIEYL